MRVFNKTGEMLLKIDTLTGADLRGADLRCADLRYANLRGTEEIAMRKMAE